MNVGQAFTAQVEGSGMFISADVKGQCHANQGAVLLDKFLFFHFAGVLFLEKTHALAKKSALDEQNLVKLHAS